MRESWERQGFDGFLAKRKGGIFAYAYASLVFADRTHSETFNFEVRPDRILERNINLTEYVKDNACEFLKRKCLDPSVIRLK